jgi:hypothetical protein
MNLEKLRPLKEVINFEFNRNEFKKIKIFKNKIKNYQFLLLEISGFNELMSQKN